MWKGLLVWGSRLGNIILCLQVPFQMQTRSSILMTDDLQEDLQFSLVVTSSLGVLGNKQQFLDQAQRLSIKLWPMPLKRWCEYINCFMSQKFDIVVQRVFGVIILMSSISWLIQCFMLEQNTASCIKMCRHPVDQFCRSANQWVLVWASS